MKYEAVSDHVSISSQLSVDDIPALVKQGVEVLVCNRPDGEEPEQTSYDDIARALESVGIKCVYLPFVGSAMTRHDIEVFAKLLAKKRRLHAYCRSGARCKTIYTAAQNLLSGQQSQPQTIVAGVDASHMYNGAKYDVVIVGAGSAGIATASSLRKRNKKLRIALIDPSEYHFYQPGWTLVGGGAFQQEATRRRTRELIPPHCDWIRQAVHRIQANDSMVTLKDGSVISYTHLVLAVGIVLDWHEIDGLEQTLGDNGVTSNYRYDLAPYTWELVRGLERGIALFSQPPMPIKCAGAPQKAMYLSASEWYRHGNIASMEIGFYSAGEVLFGVSEYVPALMRYVEHYGAQLNFGHTLISVDGAKQIAVFEDIEGRCHERHFNMLHAVPPQSAPSLIAESGLDDETGWLDVDPFTLKHTRHNNIWGVGDAISASNAKTMAAARKQAPVVAQNIVNAFKGDSTSVYYDGYGSCPLMVEHGKVVLAEFTYGGKVAPSFPHWMNEGTRPTRFSWLLKKDLLPYVYWQGMLKGREWLAGPKSSME